MFGHHTEQANLPRVPHVTAPAQLGTQSRNLDHANDGTVLLPKERHRSQGDGLRMWHLTRLDVDATPDRIVDPLLNALQQRATDRPMMRKIETQPIRLDHRTRLVHVLAKRVPQRSVQQVRARVIALRVAPSQGRHARDGAVERHRTRDNANRGDPSVDALHIVHIDSPAGTDDLAVIGNLSATFGVERCLMQHDGDAALSRGSYGRDQRLDFDGVVPHKSL